MKVNFWQVLGLLLIIVGVVFVARNKMGSGDVKKNGAPAPTPPPATTPATP
jgi:drug/metabolite transporter (DMT)-like permease